MSLSASRVRILHPSFTLRSLMFVSFLCPLIYDTALHLSGPRFTMGPVVRRAKERTAENNTVTIDTRFETENLNSRSAVRLATRYFGLPRGACGYKLERGKRGTARLNGNRRSSVGEKKRARGGITLNRENQSKVTNRAIKTERKREKAILNLKKKGDSEFEALEN